MILPSSTSSAPAWPRPSAASTTSPPTTRSLPPFPSSCRPAARSAISRCRSPSSWRAGCARRRGSSRRRSSRRSGHVDGFARIEAAPNGYVNFFLDRPAQSRAMADARRSAGGTLPTDGKAIVEHTAINPNKAAHIGHLRNAALGDAFGRLLRFRGRDGRDPELHRRHRRAGRRRRRRLPRARTQGPRRGARDRRHRRGSTTTAGTSTPASPSGTRRTRTRLQDPHRGAARHRARRQRDRRPRRASSPIASSAAI